MGDDADAAAGRPTKEAKHGFHCDARERAALRLTDAVTHVAQTHVPDEVWAEAEAHFEPDELANLIFAIGAINLWNRLMVAVRAVPKAA